MWKPAYTHRDTEPIATPVFHDFVRQSPTKIRLRRVRDSATLTGFIPKPAGYILFKAPFSDDVTGHQIAEWLKTAPPENVTAITIEAVVSRTRRMQNALKDGIFPAGSMFEQLPTPARLQISRCMRNLNTVIAVTAERAKDASCHHTQAAGETKEAIEHSLLEMENVASAICEAIETPLLLGVGDPRGKLSGKEDDRFYELVAAADVDAALGLRQAVLDNDGLCRYSCEIRRDKIVFDPYSPRRRASGSNSPHPRQFRFGTMDGRPVIIEKYRYREAPDRSGEPCSRTLQQVRKMAELLCHPKRRSFHVLPCAGFFCDRVRQELGLVFEAPPIMLDAEDASGSSGFITLADLYKQYKLVPLGQRIHLAWALTTAVEQFHRVGWVHKNIRSDIVAFVVRPETASSAATTTANVPAPLSGRFDPARPYLFGFEYARAGDGTTYLDEDHSPANNLYRHPQRWGRPAARFEKSHDVYALGVVLLEIALWKDVGTVFKSQLEGGERIVAGEVAEALMQRCRRALPHQVGDVLAQSIMTCLDFGARTEGVGEYEAQLYFQQNITQPIGRAIRRV